MNNDTRSLPAWPYPRWVAHRGAGKLAPENTLAAFRLGAQYGYRMFECDVKLSGDGVPFLLHDSTLERTTDGQGTAGEQDYGALAVLDAGGWHSRAYAGESLPTLAHIVRFCLSNDLLLNIEIKPTPGQETETGRVVAEHAAQAWQRASVMPLLSSFKTDSLAAAMAAAPHLPRALLLDTLWEGCMDQAKELGCVALVCKHSLWDSALVATAHAMGMRCLSYTVNEAVDAHALWDLKTDGIITDRVDLFSPAS